MYVAVVTVVRRLSINSVVEGRIRIKLKLGCE